ncbi:MAG: DUF2914 domain-containing protein [FCB group bacterium]|nr:DUF2914 domain-containing protein [FCB group bacterium]
MNDPTILPVTLVLLILISIAYFQRLYRIIGLMIITYVFYLSYIFLTLPATIPDEMLVPPANTSVSESVVTDTAARPVSMRSTPTKETLKPDTVSQSPSKRRVVEDKLVVNTIAIATGVNVRTPTGVASVFPNDVGKLICFTGIRNLIGNGQKITHAWRYDGKFIADIDIDIGRSYNWRCWSRVTIQPEWIGPWQVTVYDTSGASLGAIEFEIVAGDSL